MNNPNDILEYLSKYETLRIVQEQTSISPGIIIATNKNRLENVLHSGIQIILWTTNKETRKKCNGYTNVIITNNESITITKAKTHFKSLILIDSNMENRERLARIINSYHQRHICVLLQNEIFFDKRYDFKLYTRSL